MVSKAQTVVDKDAVMVKLLHTSVAEIAVFSLLWPQRFTRHTHVVEMVILLDQPIQQLLEIGLLRHVARINHCQCVKYHSSHEKEIRYNEHYFAE